MKYYAVILLIQASMLFCATESEQGDSEYEQFKIAQKIVRTVRSIMEEARKRGEVSDIHIEYTLSPQFGNNNTLQGFLLEYHYGAPEWLLTPWGKIKIACCLDGDLQTIKDELDKNLTTVEKLNKHGQRIDKITAFQGIPLPDVFEDETKADNAYLKEQWQKLEKRYKQEE